MASESCFSINWKLLPIKLHYFFMYGGLVGVLHMANVRIQDFANSITSRVILQSLVTTCSLISKLSFGFITDKHGNIGNILKIMLLVTAISSLAIFYIPPIESIPFKGTSITAACNEESDKLVINLSNYEHDHSCDELTGMAEYSCEIVSRICREPLSLGGSFNLTNSLPNGNTKIKSFLFKVRGKDISNQDCDCLEKKLFYVNCEPDVNLCNSFNKQISEFNYLKFWIFVLLYIISVTSTGTMMSLTDALFFKISRVFSNQYGKQRLWGTIGWRVTYFALRLHGMFTYAERENLKVTMLLVIFAFFLPDMFLLCLIPLETSHVSIDICKNVIKTFSSLKTIVFAVGVFICGAFCVLLDTYKFELFIMRLGADTKSTLFLLLDVCQYLVAEVGFFFFSGWFVKKIGHFCCLIAALVAFSVKMGLYSILHNPWWGLPIQCLHGLTFSLFFTAMTLYAVNCAPPGTEATILGIFGGFFENLGVVPIAVLHTVNLINLIETSCQRTFFVASMISVGSALALTLFYIFMSRSENNQKQEKGEELCMEETFNCTS